MQRKPLKLRKGNRKVRVNHKRNISSEIRMTDERDGNDIVYVKYYKLHKIANIIIKCI